MMKSACSSLCSEDVAIRTASPSKTLLDTLSTFFVGDVEIKAPLISGIKKIGSHRLEKNLGVLIEDFAERLALEDNLHNVAQFVSLRR